MYTAKPELTQSFLPTAANPSGGTARRGGHLGSLREQCSQQDPDMAKEKGVLHADPGHSSDARSRYSKQSIDDVSIAPPRCFGGLSEIPPCLPPRIRENARPIKH